MKSPCMVSRIDEAGGWQKRGKFFPSLGEWMMGICCQTPCQLEKNPPLPGDVVGLASQSVGEWVGGPGINIYQSISIDKNLTKKLGNLPFLKESLCLEDLGSCSQLQFMWDFLIEECYLAAESLGWSWHWSDVYGSLWTDGGKRSYSYQKVMAFPLGCYPTKPLVSWLSWSLWYGHPYDGNFYNLYNPNPGFC